MQQSEIDYLKHGICPDCGGSGDKQGESCTFCEGKGVENRFDGDERKLIMELVNLDSKRSYYLFVRAIQKATFSAMLQKGCEITVSFDTQAEVVEARKKIGMALIVPDLLSKIFPGIDESLSTPTQIELTNGSCILFKLKGGANNGVSV